MANYKKFDSTTEFKKYYQNQSLKDYVAVIGSGFAASSVLKNYRGKAIIFEKGVSFKHEKLNGIKFTNNNKFKIKFNSVEESLGGTSNTWTGRLSEMNRKEFADNSKDICFVHQDLVNKYYREAWNFFGFKNYKQQEKAIGKFTERILPSQRRPLRVLKNLSKLKADIVLNSEITVVGEDEIGTYLMLSINGNKNFKIYFKKIILACGGIRSNFIIKESLKGKHLSNCKNISAGVCYMNHPKVTLENFFRIIPNSSPFKLKDSYESNLFGYSFSEKFQKKNNVRNTYFTFHPIFDDEDSIEFKFANQIVVDKKNTFNILNICFKEKRNNKFSFYKLFINLLFFLGVVRKEVKNFNLEYFCEMFPNPKNDIEALNGEFKSNVNLSDQDIRTLDLLHLELKKIFKNKISFQYENVNFSALNFNDASHHIGGLPIAGNNSNGAVDQNLRIIDTQNIYVCSSAVFPNSGSSNPTLTIVALGLRLGRHLNSFL